eukprot:UN03498
MEMVVCSCGEVLMPVDSEHEDEHLTPTLNKTLENEKIELAVGGWDYSLALTTSGVLYSWGVGTHGVLGHGDT